MDQEIENIELRNLRIDDYQELKQSMISAYADWENSYWRESSIPKVLEPFIVGPVFS